MDDNDETRLPGIGTRHDLRLENGERMGVVLHRGSDIRELLLYDPDDPDSCQATVRLSETDVRRLVELLQPGRGERERG